MPGDLELLGGYGDVFAASLIKGVPTIQRKRRKCSQQCGKGSTVSLGAEVRLAIAERPGGHGVRGTTSRNLFDGCEIGSSHRGVSKDGESWEQLVSAGSRAKVPVAEQECRQLSRDAGSCVNSGGVIRRRGGFLFGVGVK